MGFCAGHKLMVSQKISKSIPAVSIVVVGIFVNAVALLSGTVGLFTQLGMGFGYLLNPDFQPNWLLAKDAFWFFGHPIVYFTLFSFLAQPTTIFPSLLRRQFRMISGLIAHGHFILFLQC